MKIKDTLIVVLSDMHSGGSTALFPNRFWQGKNQNHVPTAQQRKMHNHFVRCALHAGQARRNKRLIVIHDGDAIDGNHHGSLQAVTFDKDEQADIHVGLMDEFLRRAKFNREKGDRLYYVTGTEVHTGDKEDRIAKDLSASVHDELALRVNGRLLWFLHHGKKRGAGANEGNAYRNWMRDVFIDSKKFGFVPPDMIISGHTHTPTYTVHVSSDGDGFHVTHGIICPSWQAKTRYAYMVGGVEVNEIGAVFIEITAEGDIRQPKMLKMETGRKKATEA